MLVLNDKCHFGVEKSSGKTGRKAGPGRCFLAAPWQVAEGLLAASGNPICSHGPVQEELDVVRRERSRK